MRSAPRARRHAAAQRAEHLAAAHGRDVAEHAETLAGVQAVAETLATQCPKATIHIIEIFPRGERINPMRGDIAQINQALRAHVDEHNKATKQGKARLAIHAIGDRFVRADGTIDAAVMPDFLHLSKDGYRIWGEALLPLVSK
jgi:lysophospholipase L1-like esterase